jgi:preprotein translocase subunit SecG
MTFLLYTVITLFIIVSVILILLVLIQKGRGGGLASAFGGGAGGATAFGSKTGDVLTWATAIVFGVFLLLGVAANLTFTKYHEIQKSISATGVPSQEPVEDAPPAPTSDGPAGPAPSTPAPATTAPNR